MKNKHILIVFFIGMVTVMAGAWMRLEGSVSATLVLSGGLVIQAISMVLLVIKIFRGNNNSGFLDS